MTDEEKIALNRIEQVANDISVAGKGLLMSTLVWIDDMPAIIIGAVMGQAAAKSAMGVVAAALTGKSESGRCRCLLCEKKMTKAQAAVIGGLHAPQRETDLALMFLICRSCGAGNRAALKITVRDKLVYQFDGGLRPLSIHEEEGHG